MAVIKFFWLARLPVAGASVVLQGRRDCFAARLCAAATRFTAVAKRTPAGNLAVDWARLHVAGLSVCHV